MSALEGLANVKLAQPLINTSLFFSQSSYK